MRMSLAIAIMAMLPSLALAADPTPLDKCQADETCRGWMNYAGALKASRDANEQAVATAKAQAALWKIAAENWKASAEELARRTSERPSPAKVTP